MPDPDEEHGDLGDSESSILPGGEKFIAPNLPDD